MKRKAAGKAGNKKVALKKKANRKAGVWGADIWPQERDFMSRPHRYKYVRKLVQTEGCVFCQARDQGVGAESLVLHRGKNVLVMLNKYPYNAGHILVLPTVHVGDLLELSEQAHQEICATLRVALAAVRKVYNCSGANLGLNHGNVAGAGIPDHLHWHIVPRWAGDTNFFPIIAETKVLAETLEQSYEKLAPHFAQLK